MKKIILSSLDLSRITDSIRSARQKGSISALEAENLAKELEGAQIVEPVEMPADVVTMNSVVKIRFIESNKAIRFQIVYPDQANIKENKISIFSPVATALIGYKVSDEVEWIVPAGLTKIRIEEILYQPEAAGDYNL